MKLQHYGFFLLRTPALPLKWVQEIFSQKDPSQTIERALQDPQLAAILWSCAHRLVERRNQNGKQKKEIDRKLCQYLLRAASRPTPSGLMAGTSKGKIGPSQILCPPGPLHQEIAVDLDAKVQQKIMNMSSQTLAPASLISLNPCLHVVDGVAALSSLEEKWFKLRLPSQVVTYFSEWSPRAVPWKEVLRRTAKDLKLTAPQTRALLEKLLQVEFLCPHGSVTSLPEEGGKQCAFLEEEQAGPYRQSLRNLHGKSFSHQGELIRQSISQYRKQFPDIDRPLHFELIKRHQPIQLSEKDLQRIKEGIRVLNDLFCDFARRHGRVSKIGRWADRIVSQFGSGPVDVLQLIGPFTKPTHFQMPNSRSMPETVQNFYHQILERSEALGKRAQKKYLISNSEIAEYRHKNEIQHEFQRSISLTAKVHIVEEDGKTLYWLKTVFGGSPLSHLARFANFNDQFQSEFQTIAETEKRLFGLCADIANRFPDVGPNAHLRPSFFDHEISVNEMTGPKKTKVLHLQDLAIVAEFNKVKLIHKSTGQVIHPVFTSPMNILERDYGIVSLLALIGMKNWVYCLTWFWEGFEGRSHFPRIQYHDVILSLESWHIPVEEMRQCLREADPWSFLQVRWQLPEMVCLVEGDQHMPLNLKTELGRDILRTSLSKGQTLVLSEYLSSSPVELAGERYAAEAFIPLYHEGEIREGSFFPLANLAESPSQINLSPASSCQYFVVECNEHAQDYVLARLHRALKTLQKKWKIRKWFFIRYDYPHFHLRLRFFLAEPEARRYQFMGEMFRLFESWRSQSWISQFRTEIYQREIQTYGSLKGVELFEEFSHVDSMQFLEFNHFFKDELEARAQSIGSWPSAFHMESMFIRTMQWFHVFEFSQQETVSLLRALQKRKRLGRISLGKAEEQRVEEHYRRQRSEWAAVMTGASVPSRYAIYLKIASQQEALMKKIAQKWMKLHRQGEIPISKEILLERLFHMGVNRTGLLIDPPQEQLFCKWYLNAYLQSLFLQSKTAEK